MKKMWVFPFLMATILIVAAGCGKSEPVDTPENEPKEEEPSEETPSESPETEEPSEENPEEEKTCSTFPGGLWQYHVQYHQ